MTDIYELAQYYEQVWENPKDPRKEVFQKLNRLIASRLPPGNGKRALDLGSGRGRILGYLVSKGYRVTGVEVSETFVKELRMRFPEAEIVHADLRAWGPRQVYDVTTVIQVTQNLPHQDLLKLLERIYPYTRTLLINISNRRSFHGLWVQWRRFKAPFVYPYLPEDLEEMLRQTGFRITYRAGVGLLTPVTLFSGFRWRVIPGPVARLINQLDSRFPTKCHLYYVEAEGGAQP
jgi:cyclopropane fatty-acyl-phospholipid synthase-like methyltransferase